MPSFGVELERRCAASARALGRDLRGDEIERLAGELFADWIADGRLDELIRSVLSRFGTEGGLAEIIALAHHLRAVGDGPGSTPCSTGCCRGECGPITAGGGRPRPDTSVRCRPRPMRRRWTPMSSTSTVCTRWA